MEIRQKKKKTKLYQSTKQKSTKSPHKSLGIRVYKFFKNGKQINNELNTYMFKPHLL